MILAIIGEARAIMDLCILSAATMSPYGIALSVAAYIFEVY